MIIIPQFVAPATMTLVHTVEWWSAYEWLLRPLLLLLPEVEGWIPALLSIWFPVVSRRVASRCRTHQRSAERRFALSPGQTELCSAASGPSCCLLSLLRSLLRSLLLSLLPSSRSGVPELLLRRDVGDAPLKWTQVRFILLLFIIIASFYFCSSGCPV